MSGRRVEDRRGCVAVVRCADRGPSVLFLGDRNAYTDRPHAKWLTAGLRIAAHIYGNDDGDDDRPRLSWPRAVWVQARPGEWVPA